MTDGAMLARTIDPPADTQVLSRLQDVCEARGMPELATALSDLAGFVAGDLVDVEMVLTRIGVGDDLVEKSARHLLSLEGKRLRPVCVALAARAGTGFDERARDLAVAVELVHSATLLHDDVVDQGTVRRGEPTARLLYGNAASVFAGDWLLIEALRRVRKAGVDRVLDSLLETIDTMIVAEALQLEHRGRLMADRETYFSVIDGKTASLFRWAMQAGGRAGGLPESACRALEDYGRNLGLAFQIIDDTLDLAGDAAETGKALFIDLAEGKVTYPILIGLERDPSLRPWLERAAKEGRVDADIATRVTEVLKVTGAMEETTALAQSHVDRAIERLTALPPSAARDALEVVARAALSRKA